jgi:Zn-dependent protease with chaperone function
VNFFEAQDRARRTTRWLVVAYAIATLLIVTGVTAIVGAVLYTSGIPSHTPDPAVLVVTAGLTALLIVGSTFYKTATLSVGGSRVASDMGGTPVPPDVQEPLRARLRNIVEEMSIASGVPVPDIFVLEAEDGINAFAAGYTPGDAAIAVTRGALDVLNRDELQGVIAHEFSHVMNGDMRINIRMMGVLFGIMVLSIIGRIVIRGGYHSSAISSRRDRGAPAIMAVGVGLAILGAIGVFFARLIKAAVSRQRESLADASAVQFTRQTRGLADALKKIGGYTERSYLRAVDPEEISHMLFARGSRRLMSLFATHPPLIERIRALDPSFREEDFVVTVPQPKGTRQRIAEGEDLSTAVSRATGRDAASFAGGITAAADVAATVGNPDARQIGFARQLRQSIPEVLYDAAHSPDLALLLTLALVLDRSGRHLTHQLHLIAEQLGADRCALVKRYYDQLQEAGPAYALPLLEVAFPALKRRPGPQLQFLIELVRRLVETDSQVDLYEYCFYRILTGSLRQSMEPAHPGVRRRVSKGATRRAALQLLRIVADRGHDTASTRDEAFRAGIAHFGRWAASDSGHSAADSETVTELDRSIEALRRLDSSGKEKLIEAVSATIGHDRRLTLAEAELMRAICAGLDCPLPPLITEHPLAPTELRTRAPG